MTAERGRRAVIIPSDDLLEAAIGECNLQCVSLLRRIFVAGTPSTANDAVNVFRSS